MIFVVDDDEIMAGCVTKALQGRKTKIFSNVIEVMAEISNGNIPEMIFLDILLIGPDGFSLLNELASYDDTAKIPIVIISSLDFRGMNLMEYGVVGILSKDTMKPEEIRDYAERYAKGC